MQTMVFTLRDIGTFKNNIEVKFLGTTLDPILKWDKHGSNFADKLGSNIYLLRLLSGSVSSTVLRTAYYALCQPIMTYALLAWGYSASWFRILSLQRRAIRIIDNGNKGAVSIRLSIYGCSMCFVNSHLSAHDNQLKDRVEDYNSIIKDQEFHVEETSKIFYHDYVFWMGDLNFRLLEDYDKTPEEIERIIVKKDIKKIFEYDQLRSVMKKGEAFSELTEKDPDFPPTFKFVVGTPFYDHKRRPAWCDRILYCVNSHNYENVTLKVDQLSYRSHQTYTLSDHRPVTAEYVIKIPQQVLKKGRSLSQSVDQENFWSLDEYATYEYVSKCATPVDESKSGPINLRRPVKYEVTFSEVPSQTGNYCLVYISQTEDKVVSVLGISDPFPINKHDID
ncbi:hypothetical protein NQ314_010082 [Rhamnusium bicolor]|uniref:Inositol polyphosphate-related phosphatase domain-containing protein n=1 Tax=Rhamnusium bicolor TaxID=1586634 RepID=A0AAV8XUI8_9CUCU|nr:hypothetical protein NQ314_010082 [Rhamnusium bicolor]